MVDGLVKGTQYGVVVVQHIYGVRPRLLYILEKNRFYAAQYNITTSIHYPIFTKAYIAKVVKISIKGKIGFSRNATIVRPIDYNINVTSRQD